MFVRNVLATAVLVPLAACSLVLQASGYPPEAGRKSPPIGIEDRAVAVGAKVSPGGLASTKGEIALEKGRRHVLVFYRGAW